MIEHELNLSVTAEEHEMINVALGNMIDLAYELSIRDNERTLLLKNLRDKSYQLWAKRFQNDE